MEESKIEVKMFAGFFLNQELYHALQKSAKWKISRVALSSDDLLEMQNENKNYVGIYLKEPKIAFKSLQQIEISLKKTLQNYLTDTLNHDLHLEIFSKVFVL